VSRSSGWGLYPWVRMLDIAGRWSVYSRKRSAECSQKRRASDQQYGRRSSDITSPPGSGSLHIHWLVVTLALLFVTGLVGSLLSGGFK